MPDFGIFRGFNEKLFGDKLYAGQLPINLGMVKADFIDLDALAFFARVTAAGGTLSATERLAIDKLVKEMKSDGIWTKMKAIYPMVGASAAACAQNLKSSSFTGTFTATGWSFASTGVTPNGTSGYFNTMVNPSLITNFTSNHHQSFYSRTQLPSGVGFNMGIGDLSDGSKLFALGVVRSGNVAVYDAGNFPLGRSTSNQTDARAFWIGSCTASNLRKFYKNSSIIVTNTINQSPIAPNGPIAIGAFYDVNILSYEFSSMVQECAFASIGDGLTDDEADDFYNAVQAFQTTLSRQV
jgi:hypothetical protein